MYLTKRISHSGVCSRREAERLIKEGFVFVAGEKTTNPATEVDDKTPIKVKGKLLPFIQKPVLFAFHKPPLILTTHKDEAGRPTVFDVIPKQMKQYHFVGRLDFMSEGLVLLTNSAELKEKMERGDLPRVYEVKIKGAPRASLFPLLEKGLVIEGVRYRPIGAQIKSKNDGTTWLSLTLSEGKNREIREILTHLGYTILRLLRVSYGPYSLGKIPRGVIKELDILK